MPTNKGRRLRIGTFNCLFGRDPDTVKKEVRRALDKHELDVLVLQEAADYYSVLNSFNDYIYICKRPAKKSERQLGILIHVRLHATDIKFNTLGDGWYTQDGDFHGPVVVPQVRISGGLWIAATHMPTPTSWRRGKLVAPKERRNDYLALALWFVFWLKRGRKMVIGDWNEPPETVGEYTPRNIAERANAKISAPKRNAAGHGTIDYLIGKGFKVLHVIEDLKLPEKSDHNLVVWIIEY